MRVETTLLCAALGGLAGCGEAEPTDEVPGMAEVGITPIEGELEFDDELLLDPADAGRRLMATGWVVGEPLDRGFHLRTEDDRVIFVESRANVAEGDLVRVIGPLETTDVAIFEGYEAQAFRSGYRPEWKVETRLLIDAVSVTPMQLQP